MNRINRNKNTGHSGPISGQWMNRSEEKRTGSLKRSERQVKRQRYGGIYIGPSVEGTDKRYVKVISGSVDDQKPSFA
ncbi:hypothetical protein [Paenibacillus lemnae]|uniref:Uncharacterized protein n=1 Tax=Paenibacillus lemnae TaxID=1330551 RepID=A0A848M7F2_PAELE|nr:hypothetical protein [Paenibacillus lemnae]NMO96120.1 hypothetical protein [Paenibacillus lemnae]